ncbi:uncharacterized protein LOC114255390 [Monomorium pharaonis]|uniref:uncharacterized protein LOC114255390 n=1 Tax=Monomorium pharaonis TaxID=307658 RepID=UPI00102E11B8|nr:uncharacterized protein LOC114255390 [Monomorium pharaonis]
MSDVPQAVAEAAEDTTSTSAIEHQVMDILNPGLHHHDLLQSYVRAEAPDHDSKQEFSEEFEEPSKEGPSGKYPTITNGGNARYAQEGKGKKGNEGRKEKERSNTVIDSEMRKQKSRKK